MKILSAAILIASVTSANAQFVPSGDASYLCTAEIAGGLAYDDEMKKWKGTTFETDKKRMSFGWDKKFVLRLKFLRSRIEKFLSKDELVHDYRVTMGPADGFTFELPCTGRGPDKAVPVDVFGWVRCSGAGSFEHKFSLITNRFLSAYLDGYVDGLDIKEETPLVLGGTCTKID